MDAQESEMPVTPTFSSHAGDVPRRILLVEDDETARRQLHSLLEQTTPYQIDAVPSGEAALRRLGEVQHDVLLTDLRLPGVDGMDLLQAVHDKKLPLIVIVITGLGGIEEAVRALQLGAYDFLTKPIDLDNLRLVLQRALHKLTLQEEVTQLRGRLQTSPSYHDILSRNPRMHAIFEMIGQIAPTSTTVLIEGETGTGKERLAAAIHRASRRPGPIVAVNASAVPETLLESELFGHEKGAFTGAVSQRKGRFELAHQGTLFLDEIGDVPPSMQARLLRVLQERQFERVGGTETIQVDVRIVAATNRPLQQMVRKGAFREDLFYRVNVVKIDLPPLRERLEDIPLLADHFAARFVRPGERARAFSPRALDLLLGYTWPGNIRELENVVQRACLTTRGDCIEPENLPRELSNPALEKRPMTVDLSKPLPDLIREAVAAVEAQYLRKALKKVRGHVGKCARLCGCSRRSITAKLAEYGIDRREFQQ
jgi:DNA-binding NtrC family response regulator